MVLLALMVLLTKLSNFRIGSKIRPRSLPFALCSQLSHRAPLGTDEESVYKKYYKLKAGGKVLKKKIFNIKGDVKEWNFKVPMTVL